jgi:hypothetical protein
MVHPVDARPWVFTIAASPSAVGDGPKSQEYQGFSRPK